jgi:hypothetical protein
MLLEVSIVTVPCTVPTKACRAYRIHVVGRKGPNGETVLERAESFVRAKYGRKVWESLDWLAATGETKLIQAERLEGCSTIACVKV